MLLYSATCTEFYDDVQSTKINEIVNAAFRREFGRNAGKGEQRTPQPRECDVRHGGALGRIYRTLCVSATITPPTTA